MAPRKVELVDLRRRTELSKTPGEDPPGARLLETCGWDVTGRCPDHGERLRTKRSCRLPDHTACPTEATERVRVLQLPSAPPGGCYRAVWFALPFDLEGSEPKGWVASVRSVAEAWAAWVARLARRKTGRGLLSRSISFFMATPTSVAHLKVIFREEKAGEADAAVREVCDGLGARVLAERRLHTEDHVVLQLIEDTMSHLTGLEEPSPELYAAWHYDLKGRRLFQSYGLLYGQIQEGWMKGEATTGVGQREIELQHGLDTQVIAQAKALGSAESWASKGVIGRISWSLERVSDRSFVIKLGQASAKPLTFQWRARLDPTPRCDICGKPLKMELVVPEGGQPSPL